MSRLNPRRHDRCIIDVDVTHPWMISRLMTSAWSTVSVVNRRQRRQLNVICKLHYHIYGFILIRMSEWQSGIWHSKCSNPNVTDITIVKHTLISNYDQSESSRGSTPTFSYSVSWSDEIGIALCSIQYTPQTEKIVHNLSYKTNITFLIPLI